MWKRSTRSKLLLLALALLLGLAGCKPQPQQTTLVSTQESTVPLAQAPEEVGTEATDDAVNEEVIADAADTSSVRMEPLALEYTLTGDNQYTFTWAGDSEEYTLWQWADGSWAIQAQVIGGADRVWTSGHLEPFTQYRFRLTGAEGQESEILTIQTDARVIYSTIWPLMDLTIYADQRGTQPIGTASAGSAWCVTGQYEDLFSIRYQDGTGYIDSRYCLINLPEYLGSLCSYDIRNSCSSIFKVHGYEIPGVSGTIIQGYEHVALTDGTYLVPYMYPCANKLIPVALDFLEQGYRIRIYDSFRPHEATTSVYYRTCAALGNILDNGQTLEAFMTDNGRYGMGNFLAPGISNHNRGISLDLTLETLDGSPVPMQTEIHDLSWYSEMGQNNANADFLRDEMLSHGFQTLRSGSEWWHYQDEESRDTLGYTPLETGLSPACWMLSDAGWQYRNADGTYAAEETVEMEDTQQEAGTP